MTTATEQTFLQDFGILLIQFDADPRQPSVTRAAQAFARHLQGVRSQAGLTREALAARSGLPVATLLALELAALPAGTLSGEQLKALAHALGEDIELFALLLERDLPEPMPAPVAERWRRGWGSLVAYLGSPARAWIALALSAAAFGSSLLAAVFGPGAGGSAQANQPVWAGGAHWIHSVITAIGPPYWDTSQAGRYAPLTLIGVLLLVLAWWLLANHDLPARWAYLAHRRPNLLINGTTIMIVLLVFVAGFSGRLPASVPLGSAGSPAATPSLASLSPPIHRTRTIFIEGSLGIERRYIVFDSGGSALEAIHSAVLGPTIHRASLSQQRHPPRERLVNTTTIEPTFLRPSEQINNRVTQFVLVCQALSVGLLYAVVWRVVQRVGGWRRVAAARPASRPRLPQRPRTPGS